MQCIKVAWLHDIPDCPGLLYSELDDDRWEVRTVEVFDDGQAGYASAEVSSGSTFLGLVPVPPLPEIAENRQFDPVEIAKDEFEVVWREATGQ